MDLNTIEQQSDKFYAYKKVNDVSQFVPCPTATAISVVDYLQTFYYCYKAEDLPDDRQGEAGYYIIEVFTGMAIASSWPTKEEALDAAKKFCTDRTQTYLLFHLAKQIDKTSLSPRYKATSVPEPKQLNLF